MGDGSYELHLNLSLADAEFNEVVNRLRDISTESQYVNASAEQYLGIVRDVPAALFDQLDNAKKLIDIYNTKSNLLDDSIESQKILEALEEQILKTMKELLANTEELDFDELISQVTELSDYFKRVRRTAKEIVEETYTLGKALSELGMDRVYSWVTSLAKAGTWIGFWTNAIKTAAAEGTIWAAQNYEVYGSINDLSVATRTAARDFNLLDEEARAAALALADVRIDPDAMNESIGMVGRFIAATGASAQVSAQAAKQYEIVGLSLDAQKEAFDGARAAMAAYGLTGKDVDQIQQFINRNAQSLSANVGRNSEAFVNNTRVMFATAGAARAAGISIDELAGLYQKLNDNAFDFIVAMGKFADAATGPETAMLGMMANAEDMMASLEGVDWKIRNELARSLYGLDFDQIKKMDEAFQEFAKTTQFANEADPAKALREAMEAGDDLSESLAKQYDAYRDIHDPQRAWLRTTEDLKRIFVEIIGPIVMAAGQIVVFASSLMKTIPFIRYIIGYGTILITVIMAVVVAMKALSIIGPVTGLLSKLTASFKSFFSVASDPAKVKAGMESAGQGIKAFIDAIKGISPGAMIKVGIVLLIMAAALMALGWAVSYFEIRAGAMIEIAASLLLLSISMIILSKAGMVSWGIFVGALALVALGGALVVLGMAMKSADLTPGMLIGLAVAMVIMAGALFIISKAALMAIPALIPLAVLAGVAVVLAAAIWILSKAFNVFAESIKILGQVDLVSLAGGLIVLGAGMIAAGGLLIAGGSLLLAGSMIALVAMWPFTTVLSMLEDYDMAQIGSDFNAAASAIALGAAHIASAPWASFLVSAFGISYGLGYILSAIDNKGAGYLKMVAQHFGGAMEGIALGARAIADAPWAAFAAGSRIISSGIGRILSVLSENAAGVLLLPFIADAFDKLATSIGKFTGADNMIATARTIVTVFGIISSGMVNYASSIEASTRRIAGSILRVAGSMMILKLTGIDEMVKANALVTVQSDIEDRDKRVLAQEEQKGILNDIKDAMISLTDAVRNIEVGTGMNERLDEVKSILSTWLPEIAESDKGLATSTNQWGSSMG